MARYFVTLTNRDGYDHFVHTMLPRSYGLKAVSSRWGRPLLLSRSQALRLMQDRMRRFPGSYKVHHEDEYEAIQARNNLRAKLRKQRSDGSNGR